MVPWTLDSVDRSCSPALASVFVYPWLFPYLPLSLSHTHAHLSIIPHFHYKTTIMCIYIIFCDSPPHVPQGSPLSSWGEGFSWVFCSFLRCSSYIQAVLEVDTRRYKREEKFKKRVTTLVVLTVLILLLFLFSENRYDRCFIYSANG